MSTAVVIAIVVVVLVIIAVAVWMAGRARKRTQLRERFGPEYDRMIDLTDNRRAAEAELSDRAARRDELDLRELAPEARRRYADRWHELQATFVDEPGPAVRGADQLVAEVMRARGYPVDDFETRADLISVDHPALVENYRRSYSIARRYDRNEASIDDLRQAFIHYRNLFDELLGSDATVDRPVS